MDTDRLTRVVLVAYGALQLVQGLWMALAPRSFYDTLGPFGAYNDHYIRDMSTWSIAAGPVCLLASRADLGIRAFVLLLTGAEAAVHTVNHLVDVGDADPTWVGVFDAVSLAVLAAALLWLAAAARRTSTEGSPA